MTDVSTVSSNAVFCCLLNAFCSRLNTRSADAELGISTDHLRLLPQADHQENSVFGLQKVFYAKSCIKATDALN